MYENIAKENIATAKHHYEPPPPPHSTQYSPVNDNHLELNLTNLTGASYDADLYVAFREGHVQLWWILFHTLCIQKLNWPDVDSHPKGTWHSPSNSDVHRNEKVKDRI